MVGTSGISGERCVPVTAAIGHMHHVDPGRLLEQFAVDVPDRARAAGAEIDPAFLACKRLEVGVCLEPDGLLAMITSGAAPR